MDTAELQRRFAAGEKDLGSERPGADLNQSPRPPCEASPEALPVAQCLDGQLPNPQADFGSISPEQPKQLRVLLVEDCPDKADRLALLLRLWGHNTLVCRNGSEVLEAATAYQPHVVLLDIGLPGMDAFQVARHLREQPDLKMVKMISITGFGDKAHRRRAKEEGFADDLIKAVDPRQLEELLLKIVGEQGIPVQTKRQELGLVCTEHTAVLEDPDQFDSFHLKNDFFAEGIHTVFGVKDGNAQPFAFCFPADHFTPAAAREWLQERGLEPLVFTEATETRDMPTVERSEVPFSAP